MPKANPGKKLTIIVEGTTFQRLPLKTHLVTEKDDIIDVVKKHTKRKLKKNDTLVISERIVAISQGRSFLLEDIEPGMWANLLSKFVHNHPGGIGLRNPYTMQLALQEAGLWRILLAAAVAVVTKPLGIRGAFYQVAGNDINAIDGPCDYTLPPGNNSAKLGPKNPGKVAQDIADAIGHDTAIIDANDYGVNVLGISAGVDEELIQAAFADNPMGQSNEQTPLVILRRKK